MAFIQVKMWVSTSNYEAMKLVKCLGSWERLKKTVAAATPHSKELFQVV